MSRKRKITQYDFDYQKRPEQVKNRVKRNAARRMLMDSKRVAVGDGKDVDHKRSLMNGGSNSRGNLRVQKKSKNRARKPVS